MGATIFRSINNELYAERCASLNEVSEQIAKTIDTASVTAWNVAEAAFSHMLSSEIESKADIFGYLAEAEKGIYKSDYHLTVVDSQTNYYLANGKTGLWHNVNFLRDSSDARQTFMTTTAFNDDSEHMIFLHRLDTPLTLNDGTRITHTAMLLPTSTYSYAFSASGFDGVADIFVVHSDGQSVYRRNNTEAFSMAANILRVLKNVTFLNGGTYEQLEKSLADPAGKSLEFIYEREKYFVSIAPTDTQDWVVVLVMPTDKLHGAAAGLVSTVLCKTAVIAVVLIFMVATIIYYFISYSNSRILAEQQQQLNIALKNAADEATKANRAKTEFLSHMSHDLRTPLNGIMGMLEIADDSDGVPDDVHQCLSKIRSASRHLYSLINDVLDMSRLESEKADPAEKPFDMRAVTDACCSIIQGFAQQRNVSFNSSIKDFDHPHLTGSELYLRQVLLNVLGNAVKFTNGGGSVSFSAAELSYSDSFACFRFIIEDTGIGMSEEYQQHIFEPFSQEESSMRTGTEGTGLGMAITKKLTDRMGGTIELYSRVNEGSRFTITLPFNIDCSGADMPEEDTLPKKELALNGMRILIAEDNELNLEIAVRILTKAGAQTLTAKNGAECVKIFEQSACRSIDAILMDVMMPVMDGLTAVKIIRSLLREDAASVPVIAMTANAFSDDIRNSKAAGMCEHLSKPINPKILISTLIKYKKQKEQQY